MIMGFSNGINKGKKHIYILIPCALALWSVVFFKVYSAIDNKQLAVVQLKPKKENYFTMVNHLNDHIKLETDYPNPFSAKQDQSLTETVVLVKGKSIQPVVNWPTIVYTGYLNNMSNQQKTIIVLVNDRELMFREGQSLNGVKLLKYVVDSIQFQYKQESKYFKLKR